jgi:hypothetical protein
MAMRLVLIVVGLLVIVGCVDEPTARRALSGAGYTDVEITGYNTWACSEDDTYHTGFKAKGPTGQVVTGTVCSAWGKGSTIRLD